MEINLTPEQIDSLAQQAAVNGFSTPEEFAADLLGLYASPPDYAPDQASLLASAKDLEKSHQQALAGEVRDFREALLDIADKHGLKIDR